MGAYTGIVMQILDMHSEGTPLEEIAQAVGLTVEEVEQVIKDYS